MGERAGNANLLEVALALEGLYGIPTRLDLDAGARARRARARALRLRARAVDAAHRRQPLHARERRRREPVPRPARDRAVRRRSSSAPSAGSCSARRAASTRSGSRPRSSASSCRRSATPRCSRRSSARDQEGPAPHRRRVPPARPELTDMSPARDTRPAVIERVCVVGAGVIGSLYAAHLSRVADVWVLTRRPEHARALDGRRASPSPAGPTSPARVHATDDPAALPRARRRDRGDEGTGLDAAARALEGRLAGRDRRHGPERPRRRAGRAPPRRLAARLRRDVHERHAPRRHARRVHPRHGDVARAVQRASRTSRSRSSPG